MPYPGGKGGAGVYQTIINGMPRHEVYVEPFLGGGAVMAAKRPACLNIGVDLDAEVIAQARLASLGMTIRDLLSLVVAMLQTARGSDAGLYCGYWHNRRRYRQRWR